MIKNKKGFTLIEIIVVVVILAVLMAVAVPSVLKYLDEADDAKYMAQARSAYTIMKTEITKALINDSNQSLSSKEFEDVMLNTDFSEIDKLIFVSIPNLNRISIDFDKNDSIITKTSLPETYCLVFGAITDTGASNIERCAIVKENTNIEISEQVPPNFASIIIDVS